MSRHEDRRSIPRAAGRRSKRGSWESAGLAGTECACEGPSGDREELSSGDHTEGLSVRLMGWGFTTMAGKAPAEGAQAEVDRISTTVFRGRLD